MELLLEFGGGVVEDAGNLGQPVEQGGVGGGGCGGGDLGEFGVDVGSFVFESGEPLEYAGPERGDGG